MTKALILSIVLVIVWGSSSIVGASPRVDKQLGQLITLTMKETSVINIIQEIRKSTDYRFLFQVDDLKNMNKEEFVKQILNLRKINYTYTPENIKNFGFQADFHMHTNNSDGKNKRLKSNQLRNLA